MNSTNSIFLAQIFTDSRQTKTEHAAWCLAWQIGQIVKINDMTFVPASILKSVTRSSIRRGATERREDKLGFVLAHNL